MPTKTPVIWGEKALGEICTLYNGRAYKQSELLKEGKYTVLRVGNFFTNKDWYYSDLELPEEKYCSKGDLLYAWSASFGPRIWNGDKVIYHYHIWKIVPNEEIIDKNYLYHLLGWDVDKIKSEQGTGTTMMHVTKGSMEARTFLIPPIPEQQRIVEILDRAFEDIEQIKENAKQNLQNAKDLFESYLNQVFADNTNWTGCLVKEITTSIQYGYTESASFEQIGPKFLRITDIQDDTVEWSSVPYCKIDDSLKSKYLLKDGDLVFARTGATVGKSYLIQDLNEESVFASYLIRLSFFDNIIYPSFMKYYFKSQAYWQQITDTQTGTGQPNVNGTKLGLLKTKYPTLNEQNQIVDKLDALQEETKQLEQIYQQKVELAEELKQSILQKAFNGEL